MIDIKRFSKLENSETFTFLKIGEGKVLNISFESNQQSVEQKYEKIYFDFYQLHYIIIIMLQYIFKTPQSQYAQRIVKLFNISFKQNRLKSSGITKIRQQINSNQQINKELAIVECLEILKNQNRTPQNIIKLLMFIHIVVQNSQKLTQQTKDRLRIQTYAITKFSKTSNRRKHQRFKKTSFRTWLWRKLIYRQRNVQKQKIGIKLKGMKNNKYEFELQQLQKQKQLQNEKQKLANSQQKNIKKNIQVSHNSSQFERSFCMTRVYEQEYQSLCYQYEQESYLNNENTIYQQVKKSPKKEQKNKRVGMTRNPELQQQSRYIQDSKLQYTQLCEQYEQWQQRQQEYCQDEQQYYESQQQQDQEQKRRRNRRKQQKQQNEICSMRQLVCKKFIYPYCSYLQKIFNVIIFNDNEHPIEQFTILWREINVLKSLLNFTNNATKLTIYYKQQLLPIVLKLIQISNFDVIHLYNSIVYKIRQVIQVIKQEHQYRTSIVHMKKKIMQANKMMCVQALCEVKLSSRDTLEQGSNRILVNDTDKNYYQDIKTEYKELVHVKQILKQLNQINEKIIFTYCGKYIQKEVKSLELEKVSLLKLQQKEYQYVYDKIQMNEKEIKKYEDKLKDKLKIVNKGTPTKMLQPGLNDSPKQKQLIELEYAQIKKQKNKTNLATTETLNQNQKLEQNPRKDNKDVLKSHASNKKYGSIYHTFNYNKLGNSRLNFQKIKHPKVSSDANRCKQTQTKMRKNGKQQEQNISPKHTLTRQKKQEIKELPKQQLLSQSTKYTEENSLLTI